LTGCVIVLLVALARDRRINPRCQPLASLSDRRDRWWEQRASAAKALRHRHRGGLPLYTSGGRAAARQSPSMPYLLNESASINNLASWVNDPARRLRHTVRLSKGETRSVCKRASLGGRSACPECAGRLCFAHRMRDRMRDPVKTINDIGYAAACTTLAVCMAILAIGMLVA
jgi:hypothetical protein